MPSTIARHPRSPRVSLGHWLEIEPIGRQRSTIEVTWLLHRVIGGVNSVGSKLDSRFHRWNRDRFREASPSRVVSRRSEASLQERSNPPPMKINDRNRRVSGSFCYSSAASLSILLSRPATYPVSLDPSTVKRESLFAFIARTLPEEETRSTRRSLFFRSSSDHLHRSPA